MAETLGSLCDKLTVVKLKQWHSEDEERLKSLAAQERLLQEEINEFIASVTRGEIPVDRLTFAANKVYKKDGNIVAEVTGTIGEVFSRLAEVNSGLWHEQEKVYEFEKIPMEEKDKVVKKLALLNLERTKCIDQIDEQFRFLIEKKRTDSET
jgi:ribosomal protein L44E